LEPLPDGIVPEEIVARSENRWLVVMAAMLGVMMAIIVVTGIAGALHPSSNVESVDPQSLHLQGEFVESNLGTALEPDGTATVRIIAGQYDFIPSCIQVPAQTPVKFRLTSPDVVHGFLLPGTNVNTMVVPGFVSEVRTSFPAAGEYQMPCNEFCGLGHHAIWACARCPAVRQPHSDRKDELCSTLSGWRSVTTGWLSPYSCRRSCWAPGRC
jgi:cytochrome c oxidase subunit 2